MASMQRSCAPSAYMLVFACFLLSMSFGVRACNYVGSCAGESLSGTTLTASCADINGNSVTSSIDLNGNIGNNDGWLQCPGIDFGDTCTDIGLRDGHTLEASCQNREGALIHSDLDLNDLISNSNGNLAWCDDGLINNM